MFGPLPDVSQYVRLNHRGAMKVLNAAARKAEELGCAPSIAVVDDAGRLLAFARVGNAAGASIDAAIAKAGAGVAAPCPNGTNPPANGDPGLPVFVHGTLVGAVGVVSGDHACDLEIGRAGIAVLPGAAEA